MIPDSAKCAKCAKCFNYACGFGSVFFTLGRVKISRLGPGVWLKHFAHFAHFARISAGGAIQRPHCTLHRHGEFGHELAHCADPQGRGYVLVEVEAVPPWMALCASRSARAADARR